MRQRINVNAICSSANYRASKRVHSSALERAHASFEKTLEEAKALGKQALPIIKPTLVKIRVLGKEMTITYSEWESHCRDFEIIK